MTLQEFTERTGFYPDQALFEVIKAHCLGSFNIGKDAFCKAYKENADGLAENIQQEANMARCEKELEYTAEITRLTKQLNEALAKLDRALKWEPSYCGTKMSQDQYDRLLERCTGMNGEPEIMSEEEAKKLVTDEFGFSPDKIEIMDTVHTYEVNMYQELRELAIYKRQPLYDSSDCNYVRFNVKCAAVVRSYEMIDGELKKYYC